MLTLIRNVAADETLTLVGSLGNVIPNLSGKSTGEIILFFLSALFLAACILALVALAKRRFRAGPVAQAPSDAGEPLTADQSVGESPNKDLGAKRTRWATFPETASDPQQPIVQTNTYHFYATALVGMTPYFEMCGTVQLSGGNLFVQLLDHLVADMSERGNSGITRGDIMVRSFNKL